MLNYIWLGLVLASVMIGTWNGAMPEVTAAAFDRAKTAVVTLAIPLAGIMALWLGMMRLAERSGLIQVIARGLRPIMVRLFPDVPPEHPAMGSMLMNMAANMLGLSNAATPLGLRAMKHLEALNKTPGTATNSMCTFLAINTSSIQLIPATAVGILSAAGSKDPTAIIGTAFLATLCAATAAIAMVKLLEKLNVFRAPAEAAVGEAKPDADAAVEEKPPALLPLTLVGKTALIAFFLLFGVALLQIAFPELGSCSGGGFATAQACPITGCLKGVAVPLIKGISILAIPFFLSFFPLYASLRGVKVYEEFVEGAKEGFQVALRIIPYLVAILVAIGMFNAAGGIALLTKWLSPVLNLVHFPTQLLPLALMRPLSGSGSLGLFSDIVETHGADNILSRMAGTLYGSTETTFYVLAVYFGAVGIRRTRHAIPAGLTADIVGIIASVIICRIVFS